MRHMDQEKEGTSLRLGAKVEQNLKVKHLWLTHYGRLIMTRLINS